MKPIDLVAKYMGNYRVRGKEIQVETCPFCGGGGHNDKYTFSVNSETGAYNCLRGNCAVHGSFRELLRKYNIDTYEIKKPEVKNVEPIDVRINTLSENALEYLKRRGLTRKSLDKYRVGEVNGNLAFPYYENGKLVLMKYRKAAKHDGKGKKAWREPGGKAVFWGMDLCEQGKPILICEGEMDALALTETGITNVVSVPSGAEDLTCVENCWDWLEQWKEIVIWPDNDTPGQEMCRKLINKLGPARCYVVQSDQKDANETLYYKGAEEVRTLVRYAKPVPMAGLLRLADVEPWEYSQSERISSYLAPLNRIVGGWMLGFVSVWTGINSSGKTTYLGQEMIEAVEQGYRVCAYSGEMPAGIYRYWIEMQIAGPANLEAYHDPIKDDDVYKVKHKYISNIRDWYRDNFYIYDALGGTNVDNLLEVFEYAAKRYDCKMFLVDNLMLITYSEDKSNFYRKQSEFIKKLKEFAQKHMVHIHLVAHPRKTIGRLTKMDVMGSGDITNAADNVFSVHRENPNEEEEEPLEKFDACIDVFKNRFCGDQDVSIELLFDKKSKRFYLASNQHTLYNEYSWRPEERAKVLAGGIQ